VIKLPNITGIVKVGKNFIMAHRPELLLGAAVTSSIGGAILAAKGGYQARHIIELERVDRVLNGAEEWFPTYLDFSEAMDNAPQIPIKEKIQLTWLCYLPAAVTVTTSVGSITGLHLVHVKEKRALATAALAAIEEVKAESKQFLKDNTVGNMTEEEKEKVLEDRLENGGKVINEYTDGEIEEMYLVRDGKTGRDVWSNKNRMEEAVLDVNNFIARHGECDLNSFYSNAGFGATPEGDDWGWKGADWVELVWDTTVRDDGRPVRRFAFRTQPKEGYRDTHA
jgi:hypothetical protein